MHVLYATTPPLIRRGGATFCPRTATIWDMTTPDQNALSRTLSNIRRYTKEHTELQKSHHFLFNLPLEKKSTKADVIVIGLNPGETDEQWNPAQWHSDITLPTEETNEFDFHEVSKRSRSSIRWSRLCNQYLPNSQIVLSEFFFWSSSVQTV